MAFRGEVAYGVHTCAGGQAYIRGRMSALPEKNDGYNGRYNMHSVPLPNTKHMGYHVIAMAGMSDFSISGWPDMIYILSGPRITCPDIVHTRTVSFNTVHSHCSP